MLFEKSLCNGIYLTAQTSKVDFVILFVSDNIRWSFLFDMSTMKIFD